MDKKIIKLDDIEIEKYKFHQYKSPISIDNIIVSNKIVVSNKISFGKKDFIYFIGYKDAKKIRPLCIFLPKMIAYRRDFDNTKCISFLIKDKKLLEKYNEIWKNVSSIIKKEFDNKPVYNKRYVKTKIKSYNGKMNTNFRNNEIPKEGSQCVCLSVIFSDSVSKKDRNYYPQVFLEEHKYVVKEKKKSKFITDDKEISSDDSDKENSGKES